MEGPFNDPEIPDGERTAYRGLVGGDEAGVGEVLVERVSDGGRDLYRQTVTATVRGELEVRAEASFRRRSGQIHAETFSQEAPFVREESVFRNVKVVTFGGEIEPYPRDLVPLLGAAVALRGLEFERGSERSFTAWVANAITWQVDARVEGEDSVSLPVGDSDAWRVRLRPSFEQVDRALDKTIDMLMPPLIAHFEAEAPHRLLRFEFPTGPFRSNPPGLLEATELG